MENLEQCFKDMIEIRRSNLKQLSSLRIFGVLLLISAFGLIAACSSSDDEAAPAPAPAAKTAPAPAAPAPAKAAPAPATAPAPAAESKTLTLVLDGVGSPMYRNEKATWPDNMYNYYFGFQELLAKWQPNDGGFRNMGAVNDDNCEVPMLATDWSYDLPDNFDDPENQGKVTLNIRQGVKFYTADGEHSELTAEDVAWSFNDAGSDNPNATHSNAGEAYSWFKKWEATDKYTVVGTFREYISDWLNGGGAGISSICGDAIGIVSKTLFDEIGEDIMTTAHGTGPLYVTSWRPNERIEANARTDHWESNPGYDKAVYIQASESATRSAMLQTKKADVSMVSIQDVKVLEAEGFKMHDGLNQVLGQFLYMAGNYWSYTDPATGEDVPLRKGFTPGPDHPHIGDPRIDGDTKNIDLSLDENGRFNHPHMRKAQAFRRAILHAIDRELIAETITAGYGKPIYGGGHGSNQAFDESHPEWKDKWKIEFDVALAQEYLAESGVQEGFEFEYFCPQPTASMEVCQATVGMIEDNLGLKPTIASQTYGSRRPTMVGREINVIWQTNWGPNSTHAAQSPGGTIPVCCLWPIGSGGYNAGVESNEFYNDYDSTRKQEKGSPENLATREAIMDRWFNWSNGGGIVEVPTLIGMNPETVDSWDLKPFRMINSFDTIVLK